jgi:hypothetical protein
MNDIVKDKTHDHKNHLNQIHKKNSIILKSKN